MNDRQRWTLGAVCVATFMLLLDITIVNVALPDIAKALGSSFSDLQWVIDAYALSLAALLLTAGALADRFGRRTIFAIGLAVFTVASLLCGVAGSPLILNLSRGVQGIGGAAMFATSLALIAQEFHGRQRGTAFGIWGATIGGAVAIGPLVGGALTESLGWESIFFINLPIGALAIWVALTKLRETRDPDATRTDIAGLVTFSAGLFLLVFALVRGNAKGWGSPLIVSFLVASAALLAAFLVVEARQKRPMFDLTLFRKPSFAGASIAAFALSASLFAMFLYLTLYIQNSLGYKPLEAGLRFLPLTISSFVAAPLAGRLTGLVPIRWLLGGGLTLVGVGLLLMRGLDADSQWTTLLAGFVIAGAGVGMCNPCLAQLAVGVVPPARAGMGSGINNTFRQVGVATGIAGLGALFQHLLANRMPGVPPEALATGSPAIAGAHGAAARHAFLADYTSALNELFLIAAIVVLTGAVLAMLLVRQRDFATHGGEPAAAAG